MPRRHVCLAIFSNRIKHLCNGLETGLVTLGDFCVVVKLLSYPGDRVFGVCPVWYIAVPSCVRVEVA